MTRLYEMLHPGGAQTARPVEFWRIDKVAATVGLSKSEIYRRMRETDLSLNPFPPCHAHRGSEGRGGARFWVSTDVEAWQLAEIGLAVPPHPNWPSRGNPVQSVEPADPLSILE